MFVVFYRYLEQGHNIAGRGWGRKAIFPPFEVHKTLKSPVLGEVSQLILSSIVDVGNKEYIILCYCGGRIMSGFDINRRHHHHQKTSLIIITINYIIIVVVVVVVVVVAVDDDAYYWVYLSSDHPFQVHYKVRQLVLLQSV